MEPSSNIINQSIKLRNSISSDSLIDSEMNISSEIVAKRLLAKTVNIVKRGFCTDDLQKRKQLSDSLAKLIKERKNKTCNLDQTKSMDNFLIKPQQSGVFQDIEHLLLFEQTTCDRFQSAMNEWYVDSFYNKPELYEDYVVGNIKVISILQFFLNQTEYSLAAKLQFEQISKNFNIDYSQAYLFFDLDETLVHSEVFNNENSKIYDKVIEIEFDISRPYSKIGVFLRPYAHEILMFLASHFKLVIFTAAELEYSTAVLKEFGMLTYFEAILDRKYTIEVKGFFIKDLKLFGQNQQKLN